VSLTTGKGPLSPNPAGRFSRPMPEGVVYVEPFRRRVRGLVGGRTVVDSQRVLLVHRPGSPPGYVFPIADVDGAGSLPDLDDEPEAPGHVRVPWDAVEEWYEEEERVHYHPRNPYHRVDCVRTTRHLQVEVAGTVLGDTRDTLGVYETGLEPRLYVRPDEVRRDLLIASTTTTYCPYKGTAWYWTAVVGDVVVEDVAWSYEDPLPESLPLRGMLSFDETRVTLVHDLPPAADVALTPPLVQSAGAE
jgi:uncharacterized protein (DUF427 family)